MPPLTFKKQNLPFLLSGSSQVSVETADISLTKKLDESVATYVNGALVTGSAAHRVRRPDL